MALFAGPVKTLAPISFGLHYDDAASSSSLVLLISPVQGLPPVAPRLSVLRRRATAGDALPQMLELLTAHTPVPLQPQRTRLALADGGRHLYVVPERRGGVMVALDQPLVTDFVRTLSHDLVWLSLLQQPEGTLAFGLFADGVGKVEVDGTAATLGRNAFLYDAPRRKAKQFDALTVTTKAGRFRLPLDRKEFRR